MHYMKARMLGAAALVASTLSFNPAALAQTTSTVGSGYWHTSGAQILDSQGNPVRIAGLNWYGFETPDFLIHGLWAQDYKTILNTFKALGYNVIRMPFSNQMVESNPIPTNFTQNANGTPANQALVGQTALQDMDTIIAYAGSIGLRVILDNHRSEAGSSNEANGLWYTSAFPQANWIADWETMATRYSAAKFTFGGNPTVIGMDLRNEPHLSPNNTGSCWTGDTTTNGCPVTNTAQNWPVAATAAGNAILAINPKLLIFVEGNDCFSGQCDWQGGNLLGVKTNPIVLSVPNQLVYSAHDYGPNLFQQPWFNSTTTPATLQGIWNLYWAYIPAAGTAPVWLGEFGDDNNSADLQSTTAGSEGQWFQTLTTFIHSNPLINWTYWALNGEDSFALLDSNYDATPASALKQSMLAQNQFPLGGGGGNNNSGFTLSPSAATLPVTAGSSATDTITVTDVGTFTGSVTLTAAGMPSGVTATFGTNPTTGSSVLTVAAGSAAASGMFTLTVTGTSGTTTASTTIAVTVSGGMTTTGGGSCHIGYTITNQWTPGFQVALSINNTSTTAINGWTLTWSYANGQTISQLWNGSETQSGPTVTVTNLNYDANIPAGGSLTTVGFLGTWSGTNSVPTSFSLNGTPCN